MPPQDEKGVRWDVRTPDFYSGPRTAPESVYGGSNSKFPIPYTNDSGAEVPPVSQAVQAADSTSTDLPQVWEPVAQARQEVVFASLPCQCLVLGRPARALLVGVECLTPQRATAFDVLADQIPHQRGQAALFHHLLADPPHVWAGVAAQVVTLAGGSSWDLDLETAGFVGSDAFDAHVVPPWGYGPHLGQLDLPLAQVGEKPGEPGYCGLRNGRGLSSHKSHCDAKLIQNCAQARRRPQPVGV